MKKTTIIILNMIIWFFIVACGGEDSGLLPNIPETPTSNIENIQIAVDNEIFIVALYDNETAKQFAEMLPMTIDMSELNGNEKFFNLPQSLVSASQNVGRIKEGDLMLYGSNCLVLFYESFSTSYSYTRIGVINDVNGLKKSLGRGSVTITFNIME